MSTWRDQRKQALADGQQPVTQFRAEVDTEGTTDLYIYDVIDSWGGYWGISASDVVAALQGAGDVTVHINSPGGEVFEALAIFATFRNHPGAVTMRVEGWAASAASMIAMAGDQVVMEPQAMIMIHDAWSYAFGNAEDLRAEADILDKTSGNIAGMYATKAGGAVDVWRAAMQAETWYTAEEAVAAGLADSINTAAPVELVDVTVAAGLAAWDAGKIRALYPSLPLATGGKVTIRLDNTAAGFAQTATSVINNAITTPAPAGDPIPDWAGFQAALQKGVTR
jgi:ATP-dependent protease ClpP protease subunit